MLLRRASSLLLSTAVLVACGGDSVTGPSVFDVQAGTPANWFLVGQNSPSYTVGVDHRTRHSGNAALAIISIDSSPALFRGVGQEILANQYRGKRVRLSGWLRQQNVVGSIAGLWMRVDGNFETLAFDNSASRPQLGTSDWHQFQIVLDVPQSAIGIAFGVLMSGRGELLADDLLIETIPATGPTTDLYDGPRATTFDAASYYTTYVGPRQIANMGFEQ